MSVTSYETINVGLHSQADSSLEGFVPSDIVPRRYIDSRYASRLFNVNCSVIDSNGRSISRTTESFMAQLEFYDCAEEVEGRLARFKSVPKSDSKEVENSEDLLTFDVVKTYFFVLKQQVLNHIVRMK
ncbi:hypothetical protein D5018_10645 [Parashewanella curva]|uniref:Uncharacterized protein n=1 Tax=Parashewanella curva TaxID=2338552 RepID=A0A3L8PWN9_9GAMM|nr:hypothetical protein [Parashewanella curva]RLV59711.1 hypothetical protein D5018_10645 [Parashewanella curva]